MIDIKAGTESDFYTNEFETDHKDNFESKIIWNKSLLLIFRLAVQHILILPEPLLAKHHDPEDTTSMIE